MILILYSWPLASNWVKIYINPSSTKTKREREIQAWRYDITEVFLSQYVSFTLSELSGLLMQVAISTEIESSGNDHWNMVIEQNKHVTCYLRNSPAKSQRSS